MITSETGNCFTARMVKGGKCRQCGGPMGERPRWTGDPRVYTCSLECMRQWMQWLRNRSKPLNVCSRCGWMWSGHKAAICHECRKEHAKELLAKWKIRTGYSAASNRKQKPENYVGNICRHCGIELPWTAGQNGQTRKTCLGECRTKYRSWLKERAKPLNVCVICGWMWRGHKQATCSDECKSKRDYAKARSKYTHVCEHCGITFMGGKVRKWCSQACQELARAKPFGFTPYDRPGRKRRREKMLGGRVWRPEVFRRANWICQICGVKTDPSQAFPHPLYPTVDHIIPLARDGTHTMGNVQCACWKCNKAKSDTMPETVQ